MRLGAAAWNINAILKTLVIIIALSCNEVPGFHGFGKLEFYIQTARVGNFQCCHAILGTCHPPTHRNSEAGMNETVFFFQLGNCSSLTLRQRLTKEIAVVGRLLKSAVEKTLATKMVRLSLQGDHLFVNRNPDNRFVNTYYWVWMTGKKQVF